MARVVFVSDIHGNLPEIPSCDLLLIAGDLVPHFSFSVINSQKYWLEGTFSRWLNSIPAKEVVGIAGNHDFIFQECPEKVPKLRWHYLCDEMVEVSGLKVYGTPWQLTFFDWAYNLDESGLSDKFSKIPAGIDILVSHSPPFGIGDLARKLVDGVDYELCPVNNAGSTSLLSKVLEIKPTVHVFGHIHEGYGEYERDGIKFINASTVDRKRRPVNVPFVLEIEPR